MYNQHNCNNTWSRAHIAAVLILLHDPRSVTVTPFHISPRSCNLNSLTNLSHSLHLKVGCLKVTFARRITAMTQARLPCVFVTLLLVAHDTADEKARRSGHSIRPRKQDSIFCPFRPLVKKFYPTLMVQSIFAGGSRIEPLGRAFVPAFIIHWNPADRNPVSWFASLILMQIEQTHYKIICISDIITIMITIKTNILYMG